MMHTDEVYELFFFLSSQFTDSRTFKAFLSKLSPSLLNTKVCTLTEECVTDSFLCLHAILSVNTNALNKVLMLTIH